MRQLASCGTSSSNVKPTSASASAVLEPMTGPDPANGQRDRLLDATIAVAGESGYWGVRVGAVAARAGVSRATFYTLFKDKEECFHAAFSQRAERLTERLAVALAEAPAEQAISRGVAVLTELVRWDPAVFLCLTHEAIVAGPRMHAERDRLLDRLAKLIEAVGEASGDRSALPDMPIRVLLGGIVTLLGLMHKDPS